MTAVRQALSRHLGDSPWPLLHVSLLSGYMKRPQSAKPKKSDRLACTVARESLVQPHVLKQVLRAALDSTSGSFTGGTRLGLIVEYRIDDNAFAAQELLELLNRCPPSVTIERFVIQLAPPVPPRTAGSDACHRLALVTRGRALGEYLRTMLVRGTLTIETVVLFGCSLSDFRLVGAVLSVVAVASTVAELQCTRLCDKTEPRDKMLRIAWLVFAQCHDRRHSPLALGLHSDGSAMDDREGRYMQQLMTRGTPLRNVVRETLQLRFGGDDDTVATLNIDDLLLGSTSAAAVVLEEEETVDAVAHVESPDDTVGVVGVVYAGYGLVWMTTSSVVACHRSNGAANGARVTLSAPSLRFGFGTMFDPPITESFNPVVLLFASDTLTKLFVKGAVVSRDDLVVVLTHFPSLTTLAMHWCDVESLVPLVDAYTSSTCRVAVLSIQRGRIIDDGRAAVARLDPLLMVMARGVTKGRLRELHVDLEGARGYYVRNTVMRLAQAAVASALQRLHVVSVGFMPVRVCTEFLEPLRDNVLKDPPRARVAVLSVLRHFGCGSPDIARQVLECVEGGRVVTWSSDSTSLL